MGLIAQSVFEGEVTVLTFEVPKISLNDWYAGSHWSERARMKKNYQWIVRSVTTQKFTKPCHVSYFFTWKTRPLDNSNCIAMIKLLEDCLFPKDDIKVVQRLTIESKKGEKDFVTITIQTL